MGTGRRVSGYKLDQPRIFSINRVSWLDKALILAADVVTRLLSFTFPSETTLTKMKTGILNTALSNSTSEEI